MCRSGPPTVQPKHANLVPDNQSVREALEGGDCAQTLRIDVLAVVLVADSELMRPGLSELLVPVAERVDGLVNGVTEFVSQCFERLDDPVLEDVFIDHSPAICHAIIIARSDCQLGNLSDPNQTKTPAFSSFVFQPAEVPGATASPGRTWQVHPAAPSPESAAVRCQGGCPRFACGASIGARPGRY